VQTGNMQDYDMSCVVVMIVATVTASSTHARVGVGGGEVDFAAEASWAAPRCTARARYTGRIPNVPSVVLK
jgi:hypothetical protein